MNFRKRFQNQPLGFQMAPMVDIMFLLLIHFMAATIFAQWERTMGISLPTADSAIPAVRHRELIINLDQEGRIFINSVEKSPRELETILAQVADVFREQPVIVRADRKTHHEKVVAVLDICRKVDISNVAFAALPPGEGQDDPGN
ncbi:MAG: biopolymer transporter ExbD [Lentisphaeria bacterium]|nr:biopolymer transporter ExbD [Lentisphaeria bacterium]